MTPQIKDADKLNKNGTRRLPPIRIGTVVTLPGFPQYRGRVVGTTEQGGASFVQWHGRKGRPTMHTNRYLIPLGADADLAKAAPASAAASRRMMRKIRQEGQKQFRQICRKRKKKTKAAPPELQASAALGNKKKCTRCSKIRLVTEFNKDRSSKSGYMSWCRPCLKAHREAKRKEQNHG